MIKLIRQQDTEMELFLDLCFSMHVCCKFYQRDKVWFFFLSDTFETLGNEACFSFAMDVHGLL